MFNSQTEIAMRSMAWTLFTEHSIVVTLQLPIFGLWWWSTPGQEDVHGPCPW